MSAISAELRRQVTARAKSRCEYCHLPTRGQVAPFPVDHIKPQTMGGITELGHLALACPCCNGHKWSHIDGFDSMSGQIVRLFNPRTDIWSEHFQWTTPDALQLGGKTAIGRATVTRLQMNHPDLLAVRQLLLQLGILLAEAD